MLICHYPSVEVIKKIQKTLFHVGRLKWYEHQRNGCGIQMKRRKTMMKNGREAVKVLRVL